MINSYYYGWLTRPDGAEVGCAFLVLGRVIATAAHSLKSANVAHGDTVTIEFGDHESATGRVIIIEPRLDTALVELDGLVGEGRLSRAPRLSDGELHEAWRGPATPSIDHVALHGQVGSVDKEFRLSSGTVLRGLQLLELNRLRNYFGYSGGPAERHATSPSVFGMLVQHARNENDVDPPGALFAVPAAEIFDRMQEARGLTRSSRTFIRRPHFPRIRSKHSATVFPLPPVGDASI